jgi:pimeloyl-ACP methyl ester carboxylesterase
MWLDFHSEVRRAPTFVTSESETNQKITNSGAIATSYTSFRSELVKRLILVGPAGLMAKEDVPIYTKLFNYPTFVKLWTSPIFQPLAIKALSRWSAAHKGSNAAESKDAEEFAMKIAQIATDQITRHSGFFRALINTAKDYPLMELDSRYKKVGQLSTPVYALWGDADVVSWFKDVSIQVCRANLTFFIADCTLQTLSKIDSIHSTSSNFCLRRRWSQHSYDQP